MSLDIGRVGYQAWAKYISQKLGEKTVDSYVPIWENLEKDEQDAWRAAATEVLKYMDKDVDHSMCNWQGWNDIIG